MWAKALGGSTPSTRTPLSVSDILVGTSSWADPGFIEHWYPPDLPERERLAYYAERFPIVELNSSFYAVPAEQQAERWVEQTPEGFRFDVKLHRYLSFHAAQPKSLPTDLRDDAELNDRGNLVYDADLARELAHRFKSATEPLDEAGKLGVFLLQLTPGFNPRRHELEELEPVIEELRPYRVAVEFRHRGWVEGKRREAVLEFLREQGAVFVSVDSPPGKHVPILPPIDAVTCEELAYLRCHGRNTEGYMRGRSVAERFDYDYPDNELEEIGERARVLADEAKEVHVLFNNNARDYAPKAAKRLLSQLG
jgi:uncharacterized protein YecE (DUF72 family)